MKHHDAVVANYINLKMKSRGKYMRTAMATNEWGSIRNELFTDVVAPGFRHELEDVIAARHWWRKIGNWSEGFGHMTLGATAIISGAAGFYGNPNLSFVATCFSTISLCLLRFSSYAESESDERNVILTRLLNFIGITPEPGITAGSRLPTAGDRELPANTENYTEV